MWHILHKRFITWAIIQYLASNRGFKMDSSTSKDRLVYRGWSTHLQPQCALDFGAIDLVLISQLINAVKLVRIYCSFV